MGRNLGSACVSISLENPAESSTGDHDALTLHPAFSHVVGIILDQDRLTQRSCSILFWTKDLHKIHQVRTIGLDAPLESGSLEIRLSVRWSPGFGPISPNQLAQ